MGVNGYFTRPASVEAEQGLLAACMMDSKTVIPHAVQRGVTAEHFSVGNHVELWNGYMWLYEHNRPVDEITIGEHLAEVGLLEKVGGFPAVNQVRDRIHTAAHYEAHTDLVLKRYRHYQLLKKNTALREILNEKLTFEEMEAKTRELCEQISELTVVEEEESPSQVISNLRERAVKEFAGEKPVYGPHTIEWPWPMWNQTFGKLDPDQGENFFYVIAAYSGEGKSSIARQVVMHNLKRGKRVVCFQLEGSAEGLYTVMACQEAEINTKVEERVKADQEKKDAYLEQLDFIKECVDEHRLFAYKGITKIEEIMAKAKQVRNQFGRVDLVMIDYLQLVDSTQDFKGFREAHVGHVAKMHYWLGKQLNCPVLGLVQLNRNYARNAAADIKWVRESAGIEHNADGITIITWPSEDANGCEIKVREKRPIKAWQVKRRGGVAKMLWMTFEAAYQKFDDAQFYDAGDTKAKKQARGEWKEGTDTYSKDGYTTRIDRE